MNNSLSSLALESIKSVQRNSGDYYLPVGYNNNLYRQGIEPHYLRLPASLVAEKNKTTNQRYELSQEKYPTILETKLYQNIAGKFLTIEKEGNLKISKLSEFINSGLKDVGMAPHWESCKIDSNLSKSYITLVKDYFDISSIDLGVHDKNFFYSMIEGLKEAHSSSIPRLNIAGGGSILSEIYSLYSDIHNNTGNKISAAQLKLAYQNYLIQNMKNSMSSGVLKIDFDRLIHAELITVNHKQANIDQRITDIIKDSNKSSNQVHIISGGKNLIENNILNIPSDFVNTDFSQNNLLGFLLEASAYKISQITVWSIDSQSLEKMVDELHKVPVMVSISHLNNVQKRNEVYDYHEAQKEICNELIHIYSQEIANGKKLNSSELRQAYKAYLINQIKSNVENNLIEINPCKLEFAGMIQKKDSNAQDKYGYTYSMYQPVGKELLNCLANINADGKYTFNILASGLGNSAKVDRLLEVAAASIINKQGKIVALDCNLNMSRCVLDTTKWNDFIKLAGSNLTSITFGYQMDSESYADAFHALATNRPKLNNIGRHTTNDTGNAYSSEISFWVQLEEIYPTALKDYSNGDSTNLILIKQKYLNDLYLSHLDFISLDENQIKKYIIESSRRLTTIRVSNIDENSFGILVNAMQEKGLKKLPSLAIRQKDGSYKWHDLDKLLKPNSKESPEINVRSKYNSLQIEG